MNAPHPSRLSLDRVALGVADEATRAHAATCVQCAAHLRAVTVELPIPNWVREPERFGKRRTAFSWWGPAFAFVAMAMIAAIAFWTPSSQQGPAIQMKGSASVQAWVKRSGAPGVWDGKALHPGDRIEFEVNPSGFSHLTVVELKAGKPYRVLHSAPLAERGVSVSPAWAVDEEGSHDDVAVLLSKAPLSDEELQRALAGEGSVWSTRWSFPKELR